MNPLRLMKSVRSLQRLQRIATVLTQHGFEHIVQRLPLRTLVPLRRVRATAASPTSGLTVGQRLAAVCNDLGPTFIKLGQMASTRPDLIPASLVEDLRTLQDHVPPFDSQTAIAIIEEELGTPIDKLYSNFEEEPLASGSIGQVHRAVTHDGMKVVVKVKRPNIDQIVRMDLHLLRVLAESLEHHLPELRIYRPVMVIDEFEHTLIRELDFTCEAANTARVAAAYVDHPYIHIPQTRWELSGPRVLTLEAVAGQNIDLVLRGQGDRFNRPLLASRLAELYLEQFFDIRTFHADPHPGNILVAPPAQISLIDFGQVGVISDRLATRLVLILTAAIYREPEVITTILGELDAFGSETEPHKLTRDLQQLLDKYYGLTIRHLDMARILDEAADIMRNNQISIPRDLVLILKTLATTTGVAVQLDPDLDLLALFRPRLKKLIKDQLSPKQVSRWVGLTLWDTLSLLKEAPRRIRASLRHLARGTWQLNVHHDKLEHLITEMDRSSNRLSFSIVIAALVVGSSVVLTAPPREVLGLPLQWIAVVGYIAAGLLGMGLLWSILRRGKMP